MSDIRERLRQGVGNLPEDCMDAEKAMDEAADEIDRLRAVITRAKDALLDGQSTQWVHDLLVTALTGRDTTGKENRHALDS
jgi:hypothetical protein